MVQVAQLATYRVVVELEGWSGARRGSRQSFELEVQGRSPWHAAAQIRPALQASRWASASLYRVEAFEGPGAAEVGQLVGWEAL